VLVVHDPRTLGHEVPAGFPETPARVRELVAGLARDDRFRLEPAGGRADDEILAAAARVHDPDYLARFECAVGRGDGLLDTADNPIAAGTFAATLGATSAALRALELAYQGERRVFAAIRPPGHHAERATAMGFCFVNHVAVLAQRALDRHGASRVAIVDFDVHHGNGTQHLFEERADVLYVSLHQYPFYPGTGAAEERGRGAGLGSTLNLPIPAGEGDATWNRAMAEAVVPALERFRPDLLLVSAGFDAWHGDPLGGMRVTEAGYAEWGRLLFDAADRLCGGRSVSLLEGGYDVPALPRLAAAYLTGTAQRTAA
jgi:acetoin utilization deacetylase AcuC-like enzyme